MASIVTRICIAFSIAASVSTAANAQSRPVIVIPGVMGSKLCDVNGKTVWGDRLSYSRTRIKQLALPRTFDPEQLPHKKCGLIDEVSIIPLFWETDVYNSLHDTLRGFGYNAQNMFDFDYDWRLNNFYTAQKLKSFIDDKVPDKTKKVDIVAHSMGGLIARIYVQSLGGHERVNNLIMLGTPHLGSAKVFRRLKEGFENWPPALSGGLAEIQRTILSFPSTYQLLPAYDECCALSASGTNNGASYRSVFDRTLWDRFGWLPEEFKTSEGKAFLGQQLNEGRRLSELMKAPIFRSPTDESRAVYVANGFIKTWSRVYFHPQTGAINGQVENVGDGTVLMFSAVNGNTNNLRIAEKEHERIFVGKEPELLLKAILSDTIWHKGSSDFTKTLSDAKGAQYTLFSIGFEAQPQVLTPGNSGTLTLVFEGDQRLMNADLSNLRVEFHERNISTQLTFLSTATLQEGDRARRTIKLGFVAPQDEGPYRISISIPGIEALENRVLVVNSL